MEIKIPDSLAEFFDGKIKEETNVEIVSNLIYMPALAGYTLDGAERPGHSQQAPDGMIRPFLDSIEAVITNNIGDALEAIVEGADPQDAIEKALVDAGNYALQVISTHTPIDTGRAFNDWRILLPNGSTEFVKQIPLSPSKWKDKAFVREYRKSKKGAK